MSNGVSAHCTGTIAATDSPGELGKRAHLTQFPIVQVDAGGFDATVPGLGLNRLQGHPQSDGHDSTQRIGL